MASRLRIAASALRTAGGFFENRGSEGFEGTAMLAGRPDEGATRCVIPHQRGYRSPLGGGYVEVTDEGKLMLASALALDERYLARIHSHPDEAFHSATDDRNPGLTAEGSLSIVCPFYGLGLRRGIEACALFFMRSGEWLEVPPRRLEEFVEVIDA